MVQPHSPDPAPPRTREPIFNLPGIVLLLIAALLAVHAATSLLDPRRAFEIVLDFGFVPATWTIALDDGALQEIARRAVEETGQDPGRALAVARFVLAESEGGFWTPLTYAFLHGSWLHVGLNAVWLAAFGTPVARRIGWERFLWLSAVTAVAGALLHWGTNAYEVVPMIGASATVSGMMAAAARFALSPRGFSPTPPHLAPRLSIAGMMRNRTALLFVGVWFAINLVFGLAATPLGLVDSGGVAWEAHIGGFLAGLLLFPLFDPGPAARA